MLDAETKLFVFVLSISWWVNGLNTKKYLQIVLQSMLGGCNSSIMTIGSVLYQFSSILNKGFGPHPRSGPKGATTEIKIGSYVETLPRRQTILYVRLDDFLGRAVALRLLPLGPSPCGPKRA